MSGAFGDNHLIRAGRQAVMRIFCAVTYLETVNLEDAIDGVWPMADSMYDDVHDNTDLCLAKYLGVLMYSWVL